MTQYRAATTELSVFADLPSAALDRHRRGAVVEPGRFKIPQGAICGESATTKALAFVERNLCACLGGDNNSGHRQQTLEHRMHGYLHVCPPVERGLSFDKKY